MSDAMRLLNWSRRERDAAALAPKAPAICVVEIAERMLELDHVEAAVATRARYVSDVDSCARVYASKRKLEASIERANQW